LAEKKGASGVGRAKSAIALRNARRPLRVVAEVPRNAEPPAGALARRWRARGVRRMPDPFATLGELGRTAEDALGACRSRAASLRTRHEALVADGFGDAKGSGITDDPMRDAFDAFDAPARLTLVERFAEALETSHASSEPAATRADSRSSFVRLEARLRLSAKRCEAHLARGARGAALVSHLDGLRALWTAEGALAYKSTTEDFLERVERNRHALLQTWRAALAEALRASDASRRDGDDFFGASGETLGETFREISAAAALAAGACHWLEARVERSSAPPFPSERFETAGGVRGLFEEHCARALEETDPGPTRKRVFDVGVGCFGETAGERRGGGGDARASRRVPSFRRPRLR
jgi:hypothetical protein